MTGATQAQPDGICWHLSAFENIGRLWELVSGEMAMLAEGLTEWAMG